MKVLVIGSGGREHALAWKLKQSEQVNHVFIAPGNAGTQSVGENVAIDPMDFNQIVNFSKENGINLVVIGPEDPLVGGLVDRLQAEGIAVFGPNKEAAEFEGSKRFTKEFLMKHDIPTAAYVSVTDYEEAIRAIKSFSYPVVLKADGLYQGKGVVIATDFEEAKEVLYQMLEEKSFGDAGGEVVIEEFLEGDEQSLLCFVSNNHLVAMETARDYKKIGEGDVGENTGGVGCFSPSEVNNPEDIKKVKVILEKIEQGLKSDGFEFNGILFIGFMMTNEGPKILEFNVRFGDPETEVLMPRLESDLYEIMQKTLAGDLQAEDLKWSQETALAVIHYSIGYPGAYEKGHEITSVPKNNNKDRIVFHNGTKADGNKLLTNGGRVLTIVALGDDLESARQTAYEMGEDVKSDNLSYRRDIGKIN